MGLTDGCIRCAVAVPDRKLTQFRSTHVLFFAVIAAETGLPVALRYPVITEPMSFDPQHRSTAGRVVATSFCM
jgi:hypothetical protein